MASSRSAHAYAQTLGRGLRILEVLGASPHPLLLTEIAEKIQVGRSIAYRLVRTLIAHGMVSVAPNDRYTLGLGLTSLARRVGADIKTAAYPVLAQAAEAICATAIVMVAGESRKGVVCVAAVEPKGVGLRIRYREGLRRPMTGASGYAISSAQEPSKHDSQQVKTARARGYAISRGEIEGDVAAASAPIIVPHRECNSAVALLFPIQELVNEQLIGEQVISAARAISMRLSQDPEAL